MNEKHFINVVDVLALLEGYMAPRPGWLEEIHASQSRRHKLDPSGLGITSKLICLLMIGRH